MPNFTDDVVIIHFKNDTHHEVDSVNDTIKRPFGAFSWRRGGQEIPGGAEVLGSMSRTDVDNYNFDNLKEAIYRKFGEHNFSASDLEEIFGRIRRIARIEYLRSTAGGWSYKHSDLYMASRRTAREDSRDHKRETGPARPGDRRQALKSPGGFTRQNDLVVHPGTIV